MIICTTCPIGIGAKQSEPGVAAARESEDADALSIDGGGKR